jgi:hypothetical protein
VHPNVHSIVHSTPACIVPRQTLLPTSEIQATPEYPDQYPVLARWDSPHKSAQKCTPIFLTPDTAGWILAPVGQVYRLRLTSGGRSLESGQIASGTARPSPRPYDRLNPAHHEQ